MSTYWIQEYSICDDNFSVFSDSWVSWTFLELFMNLIFVGYASCQVRNGEEQSTAVNGMAI